MIWLLLIVIIVFTLLFFIKVRVTLNINYLYEKKMFIFSIRIFNITVSNHDVHLPENNAEKIWDSFINSKKNKIDDFKQIKHVKKKAFAFLTNSKITYFKWNTIVGLKDFDRTALLYGTMWMLKGSILGYLDAKQMLSCKPYSHIEPRFNESYFQSDITCILSLRVGQAMISLLRNKH